MKVEKAIQKGKSEMRFIAMGLGLLSLALAASEVFLFQNLILLVIALVVLAGLVALLMAAAAGQPVRWGLFTWLFVSAMLAFYLGGSRMARYKTPQMTWEVMLAVGAALTFLLCALYLAYSTDIGAYLRRKGKKGIDPMA